MSRPKLTALQQATQPLQLIYLNSDLRSGRTADCASTKKKHNVHHRPALACKIQNSGSYVLEPQGFRTHEGEWP